jgi:pimeloyl-ACP methyl ester carboxylesterase
VSDTPTAEVPGRGFTSGSVEADGFTIRYEEAGGGDPVVWVHGAGGPQPSHVLDALVGEFRVVAVELPGFGTSAVNTRTSGAAEMAGTLAAFIEALGIGPAHVWGTSMGGVVATHLALEHPEAVRSLIVEAPGPFRRGSAPPSSLGPEELARAFNRHPERVAWREMRPPDPERWELVMKIMGGEHDDALEARLHEIQAPTLAVWGIDDGIIPPEGGRIYKQRVPHCAYVLVYDAAHDVQGDRPEACTDLVRDFLRRGLNFVISDEDARINP